MRKNYGSVVERSKEVIMNIIETLSLKAFAEEPENNSTIDGNGEEGKDKKQPTINYEDLISKARKEEKEKQYKTIEKLRSQIDTLTGQHNNDLLKVASLEKELEEAKTSLTKTKDGDSEEVSILKDTIKTLETEKSKLESEVESFKNTKPVSKEDVEAEVRAELEAEYEVKTYKVEKMAELKDDILVPELVIGSTKEEIDNSIKLALERSNEIRESLGIKKDKKDKRTPKTPNNPSLETVQGKEITVEYLNSLDVGSKEYAEVRKQLGLK